MMLPHTLFDTLEHRFLLKPLLIAGKAMEYHGLRLGRDEDFVVPLSEFERLCQAFPEGQFTNSRGERGVRIGRAEFFLTQFGFGYAELERGAIEEGDYRVLHLELLLFLKTLMLIHEPNNGRAKQDRVLITARLLSMAYEPPVLYTLTLNEAQRQFLLNCGCTLLEERQAVFISLPFGTTRKDLEGERAEHTNQEQRRLFQLAFPDGAICWAWYFPMSEQYQLLLAEKQGNAGKERSSDGAIDEHMDR